MWLFPNVSSDLNYPRGCLSVVTLPGYTVEQLPPPEPIATLNLPARTSFATWVRGNRTRTYMVGGHTDNLMYTEHRWLLRIGITPPSAPWVLGAGAGNAVGIATSGTGLTGTCIFALRWLDSLHGRRSPLGGLSPEMTLVNQGLSLTNIPFGPIPTDSCVDSIEVWVSVDGGLFRHLATRDTRASSFTVNETALGESETEDLDILPICTMNTIYHNRQVMAGDPRHLDRVYFSTEEDPESYSGLYISTKQGEPVIGLFVVRDTLVVQCPTIHYYIQGFDESDLTMSILEPYIGGLGHHTVTFWNDMAVVPGTLDWYICNGVSMSPIGSGIFDETWRRSQATYSYKPNAWAATDRVAGVVKLCVGSQSVDIYGYPVTINGGAIFNDWVVDLLDGPPKLTFDVSFLNRVVGAMLAEPDSIKPQYYSVDDAGLVYRENSQYSKDGNVSIHHVVQTNHNVVVEPADNSDCVRFVKAWTIISNELAPVVFDVFAGNEYAWRGLAPNDTLSLPAQLGTDSSAASYIVANDRKIMPLNKCAGSGVTLRVSCENTGLTPPVFPQGTVNTPRTGAFLFKGWGVSYSGDGEQFRPVEASVA